MLATSWDTVRFVKSSYGKWHPAKDKLAGTETYGSESGDFFSKPFPSTFDQYLFSSGNRKIWAVFDKDRIVEPAIEAKN